jgi:hypothetical protein
MLLHYDFSHPNLATEIANAHNGNLSGMIIAGESGHLGGWLYPY